ncbi:MAG: SdrD B-like domain-containing protein, partial [Caldilineaceae bacterium]
PLAGIAITPDGVNPLNAPHTFTVTVESSVGFQSIEIVPSIVPPPDEQTDTCATPVIDGPLATCTVTINSSTPGIFTATAAATLDLGTLTATIVTNGRGNNSGPAIKEYVAGPAIALEKATNGVDADLPTGPQIKAGDPVTWTYTVTNVGNVPLRDVAVSDDQGVAVTCPADVLGVGASMVCTGQGFAREGQYANIGSVTARDADGRTVAATDPSHYVGYIPATLGDRVFADINPDGTTPQEILGGNGVQDVGEHGIDGIIVQLYTADHVLVAQTVTRDGGFYEFTGLPPGDYYLVFINPFVDGVWTVPNNGGDDVDSDGVPSLPIVVDPGIPGDLIRTDVITLDPGENDRTWDAGLVGYSSSGSSALGDRIWLDQDKDGVQGNAAAEPGQEGIPVVLYRVREGGVLQRQRATVSDAAGLYRFDGLDTGSYVLEFLPPAEFRVSPLASGADRNLDSDADQTRGRTQTIFLPPLYDDMSWDAGIYTVPTALDGGDEPWQPATHFIYMPLLRR